MRDLCESITYTSGKTHVLFKATQTRHFYDMVITEKDAGKKAARALQGDIRAAGGSVFNRLSGSLTKTTVKPQLRRGSGGELKRLIISGPRHAFILNYGFSGKRRDNVFMRLKKGQDWLEDVVNNNPALETLATDIGEARMEQVIAQIRF